MIGDSQPLLFGGVGKGKVRDDTEKPKRKSRPRKPIAPDDPLKPKTSAIFKVIDYYLKNVRSHDKSEYVGMYQQIQRICAKGIPLGTVLEAVTNYSRDPFVRSCGPERRQHIRKFFMPERIKQWSTLVAYASNDRSLAALDALTKAALAGGIQTTTAVEIVNGSTGNWKPDEDEEETPSEL